MLVAIGAFLTLYFNIYWVTTDKSKYHIVGMVLLGSLMAYLSPGSSVIFVYAGAFCCKLGLPKKASLGIVLIILWVILLSTLFSFSHYFYLPAIVFTIFIGGVNIYQHEIEKKRKELKLSQQEIKQLAQVT